MSFLELRIAYRENIKAIESQLVTENENNFISQMDYEAIGSYLHNQRIRVYLSNLRQSYQVLGLRLGEEVNPDWLKGLSALEKSVFISRFTEKKQYSDIAATYNLSQTEVRQIFMSSLKNVLNNI